MSDENPYGGTGEPPEEPTSPTASPYGGGPEQAPGPYLPYPPGYSLGPPPRSDRWKIWVGIGLAIPALIVTGLLAGAVGVVDDSGGLSGLVGLAGLVGPVVLLFFRSTRKLALGLLIGYAVLFILVAGACVALLASYN